VPSSSMMCRTTMATRAVEAGGCGRLHAGLVRPPVRRTARSGATSPIVEVSSR
jgi:hypothetical protein